MKLSDEERMRGRLLARIRRRFAIARRVMVFGALRIEFVRVENPDRVLDEVAAEEDRREKARGVRLDEDELHLPYWAELWDSSAGVGQFLAEGEGRRLLERGDGRAASVLDLGCGMGLAGTVAAACGASVLFGDLESPALLFAALNSLPWRERVRVRRMNWRRDQLGERFDLIIGADILYERAQWEHLEPFWREHLAPGGTVLLGEPGRQTGDLFLDWIEGCGWTIQRLEQPVQTREKPVRLLVLRRSSR